MIIQKRCNELKLNGHPTWMDVIYCDDYTEASTKCDELRAIDPSSEYRLVDVIW